MPITAPLMVPVMASLVLTTLVPAMASLPLTTVVPVIASPDYDCANVHITGDDHDDIASDNTGCDDGSGDDVTGDVTVLLVSVNHANMHVIRRNKERPT